MVYIWDVYKGKLLHRLDAPNGCVMGLRISEHESMIFCLDWSSVHAWSSWTAEAVGKEELGLEVLGPQRSLIVGCSTVWVHSLHQRPWDGCLGSQTHPSPLWLSGRPALHFNDTKFHLSGIEDTITGQVIFQLGGRFTKPVDVQSNGQYLHYQSEEVLILDFNHMSL